MVFTREKNDTSNQNREQCFFTCEKNDTSNQRPQRQARNQDFIWGGANETKVDQTTEMYILLSDPFI